MKLKDLKEGKKEKATPGKKLADWCSYFGVRDRQFQKPPGGMYLDGTKISSTKSHVVLIQAPRDSLREFESMHFGSNDWDYTFVHRVEFSYYKIKDFSLIPNIHELSFQKCKIESFKGIENLTNLMELHLAADLTEPGAGFLRLLKCKSLKSVDFYNKFSVDPMPEWNYEADSPYSKEAKRRGDLHRILNRYLKESTRSIPDCQQELIEEGLQEFAKL